MISLIYKLSGIIIFIMFQFPEVPAQTAILSTGNDRISPAGQVSFSIGQVFYQQNYVEGNATIIQGVQQPYEISLLLNTAQGEDISVNYSVFPNPVIDILNLVIPPSADHTYHIKLYDNKGLLLKEQIIYNKNTAIPMAGMKSAVYFIAIYQNEKLIELIRIMKI